MRKTRPNLQRALALTAVLLPSLALAAGPVLKVERVDASKFPILRAYVSLVGGNGSPITGLSKENFKVFELKTNEVEPQKVQALDASGYGTAIAIVLQASGTMAPVMDDMKKSTAGYLGALGEKDQAGVVIYSDKVDVLAPMGDKAAASGAVNKIDNPGYQKLMFDGIAQGMGFFTAPTLPAARALIVLGDGGDSGSTAGAASLIAESKKKRIPIFAIGHSETGGAELDQLRELAHGATGDYAYVDAAGAEDFAKAFIRIQQLLSKQYVVEWKADDIEADKKTYPLEIAVEVGETKLRGSGEVETPFIKSYTTLIVIGVILLILLIVAGVIIYIKTRPPPPKVIRKCPVCSQEQMAQWDVCMFCLKNAKGTLKVTKGPSPGKVYPLVGKSVSVGKGAVDLAVPADARRINIPDPSVSSQHCGVTIDGTKFEVFNQSQTNGTFVNGKKVDRRFLRNGDAITMGNCELRFESTVKDVEGGDYSE